MYVLNNLLKRLLWYKTQQNERIVISVHRNDEKKH